MEGRESTNDDINRQCRSSQKNGDEDIKQKPRDQYQQRRPKWVKSTLTHQGTIPLFN